MIKHNLKLDIEKRTPGITKRIVVRQGESGTQTIKADITLNGEPYESGCSNARLEVLHSDGTWARVAASKSGASVSVTLPSNALSSAGVCRLAYFSFYTGADVVETTEGFELRILPAVDVTGEMSKPYSDELDALLVKWNEHLSLAKRQEEERVKAQEANNEAQRKNNSAIAEAVSSANGAASSAIAAASLANSASDTANTAAEAAVGAAEKAAIGEAERALAESARATSEKERAAAEALRGSAETQRAEAEKVRDGAERDRSESEAVRAKAESGRAAAEKARVTAEDARTKSEADRERRVAEAVSKADAAAVRADAAAQALENAAPLYGVRFSGSQSKGERLYASVGKSARPSTAESAGRSDFDGCDPFDFVRVKRKAGPDGRWSDIAVEGTPSWDAPGNANLDIFCRFKNPHFRLVEDGEIDERVVSAAPFLGSSPLVVDADGTAPEYIYIAAYNTSIGSEGRSRSVSGEFVAWGGYPAFAKADKAAGASCHSGTSWYETWKFLMPVIEYADRDVQSAIGNGFSGGRLTHGSDKLVEPVESGNTVKIAPTSAAAYLVGQAAFVGKNTWNVVGSADIAADERTITAIDPVAGTVTLDGEPFSATTDMYLNNLDYKTGSTDAVLGHTGQTVRDNRHAVKYRGVEGIWGGVNEPIIDIRLKTAVGHDGQKHYETYYCPDPIKARDYTQNAPSADFVNVGLPWPTSAGYIKRAQASEAHPSLVVPAETGGSSTTYHCDYYWFDPNFPDDRAPRAGAYWSGGANLGVVYRNGDSVASYGDRSCGARLFT